MFDTQQCKGWVGGRWWVVSYYRMWVTAAVAIATMVVVVFAVAVVVVVVDSCGCGLVGN
jgi:hypothetical protein